MTKKMKPVMAWALVDKRLGILLAPIGTAAFSTKRDAQEWSGQGDDYRIARVRITEVKP